MMINPMIGMPQGAEWLVILAIVVLVFGAAKLPELARGSGQALRIFRNETKGLDDEDDPKDKTVEKPAGELPPLHTESTHTDTPPVQPTVQPTVPSAGDPTVAQERRTDTTHG